MRSCTLHNPWTIPRQRVSVPPAYGEQPLLTALQPRSAFHIDLLVFARTHCGFNPPAALFGAIAVQSKSAPNTTGYDRCATRSASRSPSCAKQMDAASQPRLYSASHASKAVRRAAGSSVVPARNRTGKAARSARRTRLRERCRRYAAEVAPVTIPPPRSSDRVGRASAPPTRGFG